MSGHSKWKTIKRKKGAEDAKRGKLFTRLAREITIAAKGSSGDPNSNSSLRLALDKARANNMPKDNIERAIKRGTGEGSGDVFEKIVYEGYAANGVAIMVDIMTDNRNRAAADIRRIFSRTGGSLGTSGSVAWMFEKKGNIIVNKDTDADEDALLETALEAGAEDMATEDAHWEIVTDAESFRGVVNEDYEDVQEVYANFDISDEILQELSEE
jgi:YebC/PmpR family DNA-binding regulatory protein